jgi:hypothetical protein
MNILSRNPDFYKLRGGAHHPEEYMHATLTVCLSDQGYISPGCASDGAVVGTNYMRAGVTWISLCARVGTRSGCEWWCCTCVSMMMEEFRL